MRWWLAQWFLKKKKIAFVVACALFCVASFVFLLRFVLCSVFAILPRFFCVCVVFYFLFVLLFVFAFLLFFYFAFLLLLSFVL